MLFFRTFERGAGLPRAPLSHIDQSGCWRKNLQKFSKTWIRWDNWASVNGIGHSVRRMKRRPESISFLPNLREISSHLLVRTPS